MTETSPRRTPPFRLGCVDNSAAPETVSPVLKNRIFCNYDMSSRARSRVGVHALLVLTIALLVVATGAGATSAIAHTASPTVFSAKAGKPPPMIWGACPAIDRRVAEQKLVRRFDRAAGVATGVVPMSAGTSDLVCGNNDFGFYHIVARRYTE